MFHSDKDASVLPRSGAYFIVQSESELSEDTLDLVDLPEDLGMLVL